MALAYLNMTPVVTADGAVTLWYGTPSAGAHFAKVDEGCVGDNIPLIDTSDRITCYGNVGRVIEELVLANPFEAGTKGEIREYRLAYHYTGNTGVNSPQCKFQIILQEPGESEVQIGEDKIVSMYTAAQYTTGQILWSYLDDTPFVYEVADWITYADAENIILRMTGEESTGYSVGTDVDFQQE